MNWLSAGRFLLKHWREAVVIVSLLGVLLKTRMDYNALNKAYEISQESLQAQVEGLQKIHAEELRKRDLALQSYRNTIEDIERNYLKSQEEIENLKNKKRDTLEKSYSTNPEELSNEIISIYGFERTP